MDVAAFQLAVGLGGLLHGHGCVRAQPEPAPLVTFSCRSTPAAASAELGSAAASSHDTASGLRAQIDATAYSA